MRRMIVFLLLLALLPVSATAENAVYIGKAVLCEDEDGNRFYVNYVEDVPEDCTPLGMVYLEEEMQLFCLISDLSWDYQVGGTYGQIYFYDPTNSLNMISISSVEVTGDPSQLSAEQWNFYAEGVEQFGAEINYGEPLELSVGPSAYPGFRYDAELVINGVASPSITVHWFTPDRSYTCVVTYAPEDQEHVEGILQDLLAFVDVPPVTIDWEETGSYDPSTRVERVYLVCEGEDGSVEYVPEGQDVPAGTTPVGLLYTEPAIDTATLLADPVWEIDTDYNEFSVLFSDPQTSENYIYITSYLYPDGMTAENGPASADELLQHYRNNAPVALTLSHPEGVFFQVGLGTVETDLPHLVYDAVRYDAVESGSRADSLTSIVYIFDDELLFMCVSHSTTADQAEVDALLSTVLDYFYLPRDR